MKCKECKVLFKPKSNSDIKRDYLINPKNNQIMGDFEIHCYECPSCATEYFRKKIFVRDILKPLIVESTKAEYNSHKSFFRATKGETTVSEYTLRISRGANKYRA